MSRLHDFLLQILFPSLYYGNIWNAQSFPWMAQNLFNETASNSSSYVTYNQTLILNQDNEIDYDALAVEGAPALTATYIIYLLTSNMGFTGKCCSGGRCCFADTTKPPSYTCCTGTTTI